MKTLLLFGTFILFVAYSVADSSSLSATAVDCSQFKDCDEGCTSNVNCGWCNSERTCISVNGTCSVPIFKDGQCPPFFDWQLGVATILSFIGGAVAAGSGVGGGAIYVPIFILFLRYSPHVAVPLSKITIFGVAIGGYLVLVRKRHPKADRPLIDYNVALLMEPLILAGTIIGVYGNVAFPSYLIIVFLVLLLGFNAFRTYVKGYQLYKEERKLDYGSNKSLTGDASSIQDTTSLLEEEEKFDSELQRKRLELMEQERKIPWLKFLSLFLLEAGMLTLVLLKGGLEGESVIGVECGTWQYWLIVGSIFPYLFLFVLVVSRNINREHQRKIAIGYTYLKEDLKWTKGIIILFLFLSVISGIAAGMLGIGAGIVTGPILLEMGVLPQVATATSSYLILFTSSATTIQFLILGKLAWRHGLWYFGVGLMAAVLGQYGVAEVIKRYKKQAFINFLLATVIVISAVFMITIEGIATYNNIQNHSNMGFNQICGGGAS